MALDSFENIHVPEREFKDSRGWFFFRFKNRAGLQNIDFTVEATSADKNKKAADRYPEEFKTVIEDGGYSRKQVFNLDETGLYSLLEKSVKSHVHLKK